MAGVRASAGRHALNHDFTNTPSGAPGPAGAQANGQAFGPFPVLHQIGMGALGPVFRAQGRSPGQLVAVKAYKLDVSPELAPSIADALRVLVANAPAHGGLVTLVDASIEGDTPWLAMEHVPHPTLDTRLREGGVMPLAEATAMVRAIAAAVDAAHLHGLTHGSFHPRDVFLHPDGAVSVNGFGVAAALGVAGLRPPRRRPFTAPETLAQRPLAAPADRYALGVIAYEIVSGRRLLGAGDDLVAGLAARAESSDVARAATALAAMLAERPDHRPSSAAAFAQALCAALEAPPPAGTQSRAAQPIAAQASPPPTAPTAATVVAPPPSSPLVAVISKSAEPRPPHHGDDAPPAEALAEFARQGTFWEPPRRGADADAATIAVGASPPGPALGMPEDAPTGRIARHDAADAIRHASPTTTVDPPLRLDAPEPSAPSDGAAGDSLLFTSFGASDRVTAADPAAAESATHTPPLVVLALTLGLGLAVGGAGGYLLGQRSGERAAQRALGGVTTTNQGTFPTDTTAAPAGPVTEPAPAASAARPTSTAPAASAAASPSAQAPGPGTPPAPTPDTRTRPAPVAVGQLIVRSTPAKAGVLVNGTWRGRTPLTIRNLTVGTHAVRVVEDGFIAETRRVAVDARTPTTVSFQLNKVKGPERPAAAAPRPGVSTGRLLLESRPSQAAVWIDGRLVGTTPLLLSDLEPGARLIRIELPGHKLWSTTTTVVAGRRVRVAASLEESTER